MALTDTISTEIIPNYARKLRDDVMMSTPTWEWLYNNIEEVDGGSQYKAEINYQLSPNADNFPGGVAPLDANFVNSATEAVWNPCYYYASVMIPDTLRILGRGEGEIINLFNSQFETALGSLVQKLGSDAWSDATPRNGGPVLSGLRSVITSAGTDPAGGAFGGITRVGASGTFQSPSGNCFWGSNVLTINGGAQTVWKGSVNPGTATTMSLQAVMALVAACTVGIYRPKVLIGDMLAWNGFHNVVVQTIRQAPLQYEGGGGYPELSFAGIPILQDDWAPSGQLAAINDLWKLNPWREGFFAQMDPVRPYNALATIWYLLVVMNCSHTRPNTMGRLTGITG